MAALIFTVALNGYAYEFRDCLRSQREWARDRGYEYAAVTKPRRVEEVALCAWLKIPLTLEAMAAGYEHVMFIDSDARVDGRTPAIEDLGAGAHAVRMALGRSERLNSGVIYARASDAARSFFGKVLASADEQLAPEDRAHLKYENGNIIHCARHDPTVGTLPLRWNNTYDAGLDDYIRHYTGPLRPEHRRSRDPVASARRALRSRRVGAAPVRRDPGFVGRLDALTRTAIEANPSMRRALSR